MIARACLLGLTLVALPVHAAVDPVEAPQPQPCVVKGTLVADATIFDLAKGGQPLATITGTRRWVRVSDFAPHAQRLRIVSSQTSPSLRVEGFVDVASMPIALARDLSIAGHVLAIRASVPLRIAELGPVITAEPRAPTFEGIAAPIACGDLQVMREKSAPALPPSLTVLVPLHKSIDLFSGAGGAPITTLRLAATANVSLSGYESANGFVHVRFAGDVLIDGWMRRSELTEKYAMGLGCYGTTGGVGMWGTSASPSYAQRDTEVRLGAQGPRVGVLEKGARVTRWGTGTGAWTQIRVYDVDATEPTGRNFHVREDDLGPSAP